jgi:RNA polymerase sigma-70 factor (ECF subfamily)
MRAENLLPGIQNDTSVVSYGRTVPLNADNSWCRGLYDSMSAALVLYGHSLGLTHAESEDVLHDTFAALLQLERRPREPEGYCRRTFRNRALNARRSWLRRVAREWHSRHWFEKPSGMDARERRLMSELARLPPNQREAVVLRIWHQCSFKEIGELTGVSLHTAAGRYRYGMNRLRKAMTGEEDETTECTGRHAGWLDPAATL